MRSNGKRIAITEIERTKNDVVRKTPVEMKPATEGPLQMLFRSSRAKMLDYLLTCREFDYSESDIARNTGLSVKTVSNEIRELLKVRAVKLTRKCGRSNMYRIHDKENSQALIDFFDAISGLEKST